MTMTDPAAVAKIAERLTTSRKMALMEIGDAGEAGLGYGRCSMQARKYLRGLGLVVRLPHRGDPFDPVREILTPLGLAVRQYLLGEGR